MTRQKWTRRQSHSRPDESNESTKSSHSSPDESNESTKSSQSSPDESNESTKSSHSSPDESNVSEVESCRVMMTRLDSTISALIVKNQKNLVNLSTFICQKKEFKTHK